MTVGLSQEPLDSVVELIFSNYLLISHITGRLIRTASGHTCNSNTSMRIPLLPLHLTLPGVFAFAPLTVH